MFKYLLSITIFLSSIFLSSVFSYVSTASAQVLPADDVTAPTIAVTGISTTARTNSNITWTFTITDPNLNTSTVGANDFATSNGGTVSSGPTSTTINGSIHTYTITFTNINDGDNITLTPSGNFAISDSATPTPNSAVAAFTGASNHVARVDRTPPTFEVVRRESPTSQITNNTTINWRVRVNETNFNSSTLTASDFSLSAGSGTIVNPVSVGSNEYRVRVINVSNTNNIRLVPNNSLGFTISDSAGNQLGIASGTNFTGGAAATFSVDNIAPTISVATVSPTTATRGNVTYTFTITDNNFDTGTVAASDFTTSNGGAVASGPTTSSSSSPYTYTIEFRNITEGNNISLTASNTFSIGDDANNTFSAKTPFSNASSNVAIIDRTAPTFEVVNRLEPTDPIVATNNIRWRVRVGGGDFKASSISPSDFSLSSGSGTITVDTSTAATDFLVRATGVSDANNISLVPNSSTGFSIEDNAGNKLDIASSGNFTGATATDALFSVDTTDPLISVTDISDRALTNGNITYTFVVTDNNFDTGSIDATDFTTSEGGTVVGNLTSTATNAPSYTYTIQFSDIGDGENIRLAPSGIFNIRDRANTPNTITTFTDASTNVANIDSTTPTFSVIERQEPSDEIAGTNNIRWRVRVVDDNFDATSVNPADFTLSSGFVTGTTVILVEPSSDPLDFLIRATGVADANDIRLLPSSPNGLTISDLAGNQLSIPSGTDFAGAAAAEYSVDTTDPIITVTDISETALTNGNITWTFDVTDNNFDTDSITAADFSTNQGGTRVTGPTTSDTTSPYTYEIQFSDIGDGTGIRLAPSGNFSIRDRANTPNTITSFTDNSIHVANIDRTAPTFEVVGRESPVAQITNTNTISWRVRVTDANVNDSSLTPADFALSSGTGTIGVTPSTTTANTTDYIVEATSVSDANDIRLMPSAAGFSITDSATNPLSIASGTDFTGATNALISVDVTNPIIEVTGVSPTDPTNGNVTWTFTITDANLDTGTIGANDFATSNGGTVASGPTTSSASSPFTYEIAFSGITEGTDISLIASSEFSIGDDASNALVAQTAFTGASTHVAEIDLTAPAIAVTGISTTVLTNGNIIWTFVVTDNNLDTNSIMADDFTTSNNSGTVANGPITSSSSSPYTYTIEFSDIDDGTGISLAPSGSFGIDDLADPTNPNSLGTFTDTSSHVANIDRTAPTFQVVGRETPTDQIVSSDTISWRVRVTDVNVNDSSLTPDDFALSSGTGTIGVTPSTTTANTTDYIVEATGVSDANDIRLVPHSNGFSITDSATNPLSIASGTDFTGGASTDTAALFSVDTNPPMIEVTGVSPTTVTNGNITWTFVVTDNNFDTTTIDAADFTTTEGGTVGTLTPTVTNAPSYTYTIEFSAIGEGTSIRLAPDNGFGISDQAITTNTLTSFTDTSSHVALIDTTDPTITTNPVRQGNENRSDLTSLSWTITFSEAVALASSNITPTGFVTDPATITVSNVDTATRHTEWTIAFSDDGTVTNLESDNVIGFTLTNIDTITDAATNDLASDDLGVVDDLTFKVNGKATEMTITRSPIGTASNPRSQHTNSRDVSWLITFTRDVPASEFSTLTDIFDVSSGTLSRTPDTGQAREYTLTATATDQTPVTISLMTSAAFDDERDIAVNLAGTDFAATGYEFEDTPPLINAISQQDPSPATPTDIVGPNFTNLSDRVQLTWRATFDEPVTGIAISNFSVAGPGTPTIQSVDPFGTTEDLIHPISGTTATFATVWDITVFNASGDGNTVTTLTMDDVTDIIDRQGVDLASVTSGIPTYLVDSTPPTVTSVARTATTQERDDVLEWTVTFDSMVENVTSTAFELRDSTDTVIATTNPLNVSTTSPSETYTVNAVADDLLLESRAESITLALTTPPPLPTTHPTPDSAGIRDTAGNPLRDQTISNNDDNAIVYDPNHPSIVVDSVTPRLNYVDNAIFQITLTGDDNNSTLDINISTLETSDFAIYEGDTEITAASFEFVDSNGVTDTRDNPIASTPTSLTYRISASGLPVNTGLPARTFTLRSSSSFEIQDTSGNNIVTTAGGTDEIAPSLELPGSDTNRVEILNLPITATQTREGDRIFTGTPTDTNNTISWLWTFTGSNIDASTIDTTTFTDFTISNSMTVSAVELVTDGADANRQIKITADADIESRNGDGTNVDVHPQISGSFDIRTIYGKPLLGENDEATILQQTETDHTYLVDTDHPSIASVNRLRSSTDLTNFNTSGTTSALGVSWLVTFDDPVTDFDTADVTITGFVDSTGAALTVAPSNLSVTSDGAVTNNGITSAERWVISITDTTDFVLPNDDPSRPGVANKSGNISFTLGTSFTDVNNNAYLEAATPSSTDYQFLVNIGEPILTLTLDTPTPNMATVAEWTLDFGEQVLISSVTLADFSTTSGTLAIEPVPSTTDPVAQSYKITVSSITNDPNADVPVQLGLTTDAKFTDNRIPTRELSYSSFETALDFPSQIYTRDIHLPTIESVVRQNPTDTNFNIASGNTVTWRVTFDEDMFVTTSNPLTIPDANAIGMDDFEIVATGITSAITGAVRDGTTNSWDITATLSDQTEPEPIEIRLSLANGFAIADDVGNLLALDTTSFTTAVYSVDIHAPRIEKVERSPNVSDADTTTADSYRDNIAEWYVFFDEPIASGTIDGTDFSTTGATGTTTATAVDPAPTGYVLNQVWHVTIDDTTITTIHEGIDTELVLTNVSVTDVADNPITDTTPTDTTNIVSTINFDNSHPTISASMVPHIRDSVSTADFVVTISGTELTDITDLDLSTIQPTDFALFKDDSISTVGTPSFMGNATRVGNELTYTIRFSNLDVPTNNPTVYEISASPTFAIADTSENELVQAASTRLPAATDANNRVTIFNPDLSFAPTIESSRVFIDTTGTISWLWTLSGTEIDPANIDATDFEISNGMTVASVTAVGNNAIRITAMADDVGRNGGISDTITGQTNVNNRNVHVVRSSAFDIETIYRQTLEPTTVVNLMEDTTTYTVDTRRPQLMSIDRVSLADDTGVVLPSADSFRQIFHWRLTFDDEVTGLTKEDIHLFGFTGHTATRVSASSPIYGVFPTDSTTLRSVWYVSVRNTDEANDVRAPSPLPVVATSDLLDLPNDGRPPTSEPETAGTIDFAQLLQGAVQDENNGDSDAATTIARSTYQYDVDTSVVVASLSLDSPTPSNSNSAQWSLDFTGPIRASSVQSNDFSVPFGTLTVAADDTAATNTRDFTITVSNIPSDAPNDRVIRLSLGNTSQFIDDRPETVEFADSSLDFANNEYTYDNHPPEILTVVRMDPSTQEINTSSGGTIQWRVTFSETMDPATITTASFGVSTAAPELTGTIDTVTRVGNTDAWDVFASLTDTRNTATFTRVTLTAVASTITDDAGNNLNDIPARRTVDTAIYDADLVPPRLDRITRAPGVTERSNELRWYIYLNEPIDPTTISASHFSRTGVMDATLSLAPVSPPPSGSAENQVFHATVNVDVIPEASYDGETTQLVAGTLVFMDEADNQLVTQAPLQATNETIDFDNDSPPLEVVSSDPVRNYQGNTTFRIQIRQITDLNESTIQRTDFAVAMSDGTIVPSTISISPPDRSTADRLFYDISVSGVSVDENLQTLHLAASATFDIVDNSDNLLFLTPERLIRQIPNTADPVSVMFRNDNLSLAQTRDSLPRLFSADSGDLVWLINMTSVDEIDNPTSGAGVIEASDFLASNGFVITDARLVPPKQIRVTAEHDGLIHNGGDSSLHSGNDGTHFNVHITRSPTFDLRSNFLQPLPNTISFDPAADNTYVVDNDRPNIETFVRNGTYRQGNTDSLSWTITFDQPVSASSVTDNNDFAVSGYVPSTTPTPTAEALDLQNGFASEFRITVMGGDLMDAVPPSQDPDSPEPEGPITISYSSSPTITDMNDLDVDTTLPSSATTDPDPTNDAIGPPDTYYVDENIASLASFMRSSNFIADDGSTVRITADGVTASREWRWDATFTKPIVPSSLTTEDFQITDGNILAVYPSDVDNMVFTIVARYDGDDGVAIQISTTRGAQYTDGDTQRIPAEIVDLDLSAFTVPTTMNSIYQLDLTPPEIASLSRMNPSGIMAGTDAMWRVTFDSPVVDGMIDDDTFAIINGTDFEVMVSKESDTEYDINVTNTPSGVSDRQLRLSLLEPSDIIDLSGNVYIPTNFASFSRSSAYLLDTTPPRVESLYRIVDGRRATADPHISDSYYLTWAIEFSESIDETTFNETDLNISGSSNTPEISVVGNMAIVRLGNDPTPITGEVSLSFATNFSVDDVAGNSTTTTRGATIDTGSYSVDRTDPTVRVLSIRNASRTGVSEADLADTVEITIAIVNEDSPLLVPPMLTILGSTLRPRQFTASFGNTYTSSFRVSSAVPEGYLSFMVSGGSDRAGNTVSPINFVSDSNSGNEFLITLDTRPVIESIRRSLPVSDPISAESLTWLVEFSEPVRNVDAGDFRIERDGNIVTSVGNLRVEGATDTATYLVTLDAIPSDLSAELGLRITPSPTIVDISGDSLSTTSPPISEIYILRNSGSGVDAIPRLVVTVDMGGSAGFRQSSPPIGVFPDTAPTMAAMDDMITVTVTSTIPLSQTTLPITFSGSPIVLTPNGDRTIYSHTFPVTRDVPVYDGPIDIMIDGSDYSSAQSVEGETLEVRSTVNGENPNALGRPVGALTIQRPVRVLSHRRSLSGDEVTPNQNVVWDVSFSGEVNNIDGSDYCVVIVGMTDCTEYRVESRVSPRASAVGERYTYRVTAYAPSTALPLGTEIALMLRSTQNIEDAPTRTPVPNPTLSRNENQSYEIASTSNVTDGSNLSRTRRVVQDFVVGRAKRLLSSSPKLSDRFRRRRTGLADSWYSANFTNTTTELRYSGETDFGYTYSTLNQPILRGWIDTTYIGSVDDANKDESLIVHAGVDYHTSANSIVGLLLQYDSTKREFTDRVLGGQDGSKVVGNGWLVGPYHVASFGNSSTLETRALYGRSKNSITPTGTYTDNFDTERYLGNIKYSGNIELGSWRISPELSYLYYLEQQASYTDSLATSILPQDFNIHRLEFGPSFEHRYGYLFGDSIYTPYLSLYGIWDFEVSEIDGTSESPVTDITGRIDGGFRFTGQSGTDLDINGYYDGIGTDLESYGVSLGLVINY